MSNETVSSGDCLALEQQLIKRENSDGDCYALFVRQSLANNDLIIGNLFEWLKPSELVKCGEVCKRWAVCARMLRRKRIYFSHRFLYFPLSPNLESQPLERDADFMRNSVQQLINSLDTFIARNRINEFKVIIIFSRLEYSMWLTLIQQNCLLLKDCKIVHINSEKEIIGTRVGRDRAYDHISELDTSLFAGISGLFISRDMPGVDINVYKDCQIFDMPNKTVKCILVFHIWRSFYGHFSRLKTDNDYFHHLEQFVIGDQLAFGGVTINKLTFTAEITSDDNDNCAKSSHRKPYEFCDNICCVTFSGDNVVAKSFVIDFDDTTHIEYTLASINNSINDTKLSGKTEKIVFIFAENLKECTTKLTHLFTDTTVVGCSGIVHGYNYTRSFPAHCVSESLFYKKSKCALVWICINKT